MKYRVWDKKYKCFDSDLILDGEGRLWDIPDHTFDTPNREIEIVPESAHGPCEHDFSGPVVYTRNSGSVTCIHCGLGEMSHDMRFF